MQQLGVPVVRINTEGMCHLDANMITVATEDVGDSDTCLITWLWIANVDA